MKFPGVYPVSCHTDHVGFGSTFVVIQGYTNNGICFISTALKKGAKTIVVDQPLSDKLMQEINRFGATIMKVANARKALAELSSQASGNAHRKLKIIGITGTKGKTTTAVLLFHMLHEAGYQAALISTVFNAIGSYQLKNSLTTPHPDYLHQFFKIANNVGIEWVVMEVAAQAVSLHRIDGIQFDAVIMLNIAREHLEFYDSMESYAAAKLSLLNYRKKGAPAWLNTDDEWLSVIKGKNFHWFGMKKQAALQGVLINRPSLSLHAHLFYEEQVYQLECSRLCGTYNVYNLLAACSGALHVGIPWKQIQRAVKNFSHIPGRLEQYRLTNNAVAIIDYAHNPLSYEALFETLRSRTDNLIVVFGAGGERDGGRRPEMGRIVAQYADLLFITTDNPRGEDPGKIVDDILQGISGEQQCKVVIEPDRKQAIIKAYEQSGNGSIIALLGKGPDEYQLINGLKLPFSERAIIQSL